MLGPYIGNSIRHFFNRKIEHLIKGWPTPSEISLHSHVPITKKGFKIAAQTQCTRLIKTIFFKKR